jgi:predicted AlkP superfamily pyrophosphatase or phosphodiesterase
VVVLVDGLGWYPLQNALADAPYLAGIFGDGYRLTSTVPSTTATAITSFTTGAAPGEHGMVGYRFRWAANRGMNALTWDGGPTSAEQSKIAEFSLVKTWFQRLAAAGVSVYDIARGKFADSGLTRVAFAGAEFVVEAHGAPRADQVAEISRSGETNLTYVYERALDHTGHPYGLNTPQWRQALIRTDAYLERLRATLDADTVLLVTGDHGMVDVGSQSRVVIEDESRLGCHLNMVEGEARFRHLYTDHPREVAARWAAFLGSRAWVCRCEEAMELGWFGTVSTAVRHRIGDVVVALRDDWAVLTRSWPGEMRLVGMHGSLTPAEMCIPLLIDKGD